MQSLPCGGAWHLVRAEGQQPPPPQQHGPAERHADGAAARTGCLACNTPPRSCSRRWTSRDRGTGSPATLHGRQTESPARWAHEAWSRMERPAFVKTFRGQRMHNLEKPQSSREHVKGFTDSRLGRAGHRNSGSRSELPVIAGTA